MDSQTANPLDAAWEQAAPKQATPASGPNPLDAAWGFETPETAPAQANPLDAAWEDPKLIPRPVPMPSQIQSAPVASTVSSDAADTDSTWDRVKAIANHPILSYGFLKEAAMPELALPRLLSAEAEQALQQNHPTLAKIAGVYSGQAQAVDEAARSMSSPTNIAVGLATGGLGAAEGVAGKAVARLVGMGFSLDSLYNAYQKFPAVKQAVESGDWKTAANELTSMAASVGLAGAAGLHSLGTVDPAESEHETKTKTKGRPAPTPPAGADVSKTQLVNVVDSDAQKDELEKVERGPQDETENHESQPLPKEAVTPEEATNPLDSAWTQPEAKPETKTEAEQKSESTVPAGSRAGTEPGVKPADAEAQDTAAAETETKTESGLPKATVVPDGYKPTLTRDSLLAEATQRIVNNSEVLKAALDPAKILTPGDIDRALDAAQPLIEQHIDPRVTTRISLDEQRQLARDSGVTLSDVLSTQSGEQWNTERTIAARMLQARNASLLPDVAKAAADGDPDALEQFGLIAARQAEIKDHVAGLRAESGRTLGGFRVKVSPEDYAQTSLADLVSSLPKDQLRYAAQLISNLDPASPDFVRGVNAVTSELAPSTPKEKFFEAYRNALLSSPSTLIKKSVSEALLGVLQDAKKFGVGVAEQAKYHAGLTEAPEAYPQEAFWFAKGAAKALGKAGPILRGELSVTDVPDFQESHAFKNTLGKIIRAPQTVLSRTASLVFEMNLQGEVESRAARQALIENHAGQITDEEMPARQEFLASNPTPEMTAAAKQQALYGTYQQKLGPVAQSAQNFINSNVVTKAILPFFRTPLSIFRTALDFSPVGLVNGTIKGDLNRQVAGLLGSSIAAAGAYLATTGSLTGGGPTQYKQRKVFEDANFLPYSIKLGGGTNGGTNVSYHKVEPLGLMLATVADAVHGNLHDEGPEAGGRTENAVSHIARNMTSIPFLNQISEVFDALTHLGDRTAERIADNMLASMVVPAIVNNAAKIIDPVRRDPDREGLANPLPGLSQTIAERVPGMSKTVAPEISATGEESKRLPSELGDINPYPFVKDKNRDETLLEMGRLGITPPTVVPLVPLKRKNSAGKAVEIPDSVPTKEEARALNKTEVEEFYNAFDNAMTHAKWDQVTDAEKKIMARQFKEKIAQKRLTRLRRIEAAGAAE